MIETLFSGATGDGDTLSPLLDRDYERGYFSIIFYSDAELENLVTPAAGDVIITASEDGKQFGDVATILASTAGPNSTYDRPTFGGLIRFVKVEMSGITGANFFQARVVRYQRGQ